MMNDIYGDVSPRTVPGANEITNQFQRFCLCIFQKYRVAQLLATIFSRSTAVSIFTPKALSEGSQWLSNAIPLGN